MPSHPRNTHAEPSLLRLTELLKQARRIQPEIYDSLLEALKILLKYGQLIACQQQLLQPKPSLEALGEILDTYQLNKHAVYKIKWDDPEALISMLSPQFVGQLLAVGLPQQMLDALKTFQVEQRQLVTNWEESCNNKWKRYLADWKHCLAYHGSHNAWKLYQHSWAGSIGSIFAWVAKNTLSNKPTHVIMSHCLGAFLGALYMYWMGFHAIAFMMVLSTLTQQLHKRSINERVDDEKALIHSREASMPSIGTLFNLMNFFLSLMLFLWQGDARTLALAVSGSVCCVAITAYADWTLDQLKRELPLNEEDRVMLRFFFNLAGMQAGHSVASIYFRLSDHVAARDAVVRYLNNNSTPEFHELMPVPKTFRLDRVGMPRVRWTPSMWFSAHNPVTLSGSSERFAYPNIPCEIVAGPNTAEHKLVCDLGDQITRVPLLVA